MKTPKYHFINSSEININDKDFIFRENVKKWYEKALASPMAENSAVFYGAGGTGKTTLAKPIAQKTNKPLFICYAGDELNFSSIPKLIKVILQNVSPNKIWKPKIKS